MEKEKVYGLLSQSIFEARYQKGNVDMVKWFVRNYGKDYFDDFHVEEDWFQEAIEYKNVKLIKWLIELGYDIHKTNGLGNRLLKIALEKPGNVDFVRYLVRKGIDLNDYSQVEGPPIISAMFSSRYEEARILCEHGVNLDLQREDGRSAIIWMLQILDRERQKRWIELFLNFEEKLNDEDVEYMKKKRLELLFV